MKLIEDVKKYWDSRPCNIRHSEFPVGSKDYYDAVTWRRKLVEPHIGSFVDFARWHRCKVLELGCGIGTDTARFAEHEADVTAVELSPVSMGVAKRRMEVFNLKNVKFFEANIESLSKVVPPKVYDLIYSFGVIHHTPHPERVMQEMLKYCGPHTELRIMLYAKWSWKVLWIIAKYGRFQFWKASELIPQFSEAQIGSPVSFVYTFREVRELMKDYDIISMRKWFIFPYKIDRYTQYQYVKVWYFRFMPRILFNMLQRVLGWQILIIAKPKT